MLHFLTPPDSVVLFNDPDDDRGDGLANAVIHWSSATNNFQKRELMPLDPFLAAKIDLIQGLNWDDLLLDPLAAARFAEFEQDPTPWSMPPVQVTDHQVLTPQGSLGVRTYEATRARDVPAPALLWVHGGGFAAGDLEMAESFGVASEIAHRTQITVASVDYRLASDEIRFPQPSDDVLAAWEWLVERGHRQIALGGASAGGALALTVALQLRERNASRFVGLILAYPVAHFPVPAIEDDALLEVMKLPPLMRFSAQGIEYIIRNYVGRITDLPAGAMAGASRLDGLPPVAILTCELDELRGSAELLSRQLTDSGVPVATHMAAGMPHGVLNRTASHPETAKALSFFSDFLSRAVRPSA